MVVSLNSRLESNEEEEEEWAHRVASHPLLLVKVRLPTFRGRARSASDV
jgi:hypothetical protein